LVFSNSSAWSSGQKKKQGNKENLLNTRLPVAVVFAAGTLLAAAPLAETQAKAADPHPFSGVVMTSGKALA